MIQKALHIIRSLPSHFRKEKYCIVIEETEESVKLTEAYISEIEKTIRIKNITEQESLDNFIRPFFKADYLVFATHGKEATTIQNTVHLFRTDPEKRVSHTEFEDLTFRGLWEYFNEYKDFSSKKMGVSDGDVVLSEASASEILMDDHIIVNPIGITGKKLSIRLQGTFLSREGAEKLEKLKLWANETLAVESSAALSMLLAGENNVALFCGENNSVAFQAKTDRTMYAGEIKWKGSLILKEIEKTFGVDYENARMLFKQYSEGKTSQAFSGFCDRIFSKHIKTLINSISETPQKKMSRVPTIHLIFLFPIPKHIHWLKNTRRFKIGSLEENFERTGFRVKHKDSESSAISTKIFSAYPVLFQKNEVTNTLLLHRVKWIMNQKNKNI